MDTPKQFRHKKTGILATCIGRNRYGTKSIEYKITGEGVPPEIFPEWVFLSSFDWVEIVEHDNIFAKVPCLSAEEAYNIVLKSKGACIGANDNILWQEFLDATKTKLQHDQNILI